MNDGWVGSGWVKPSHWAAADWPYSPVPELLCPMSLAAERPHHEYSPPGSPGSCREESPRPEGPQGLLRETGLILTRPEGDQDRACRPARRGRWRLDRAADPESPCAPPRARARSPQTSSRETSSCGSRSRRPSSTRGRRTPTPSSASCPPTSRLWRPRCGGAAGCRGSSLCVAAVAAVARGGHEMPLGSPLPWVGLPLSLPLSTPPHPRSGLTF